MVPCFRLDNFIRFQVVSDAYSSKAVVLMLIESLLFLPFIFVWSLLFVVRV